MLRLRHGLTLAALTLLAAGCQEKLAAPADCPNLCPGSFDVRDTILYALPDGDTTFSGYVRAGQGVSLRVSNQLPASEDRAVVRFGARPDSFAVGDSLRPYVVDSANLEISLIYRDSLVPGLKIFLYRLPATVDSSTTFAQVDGAFVPSALLDSFVVDDTIKTQRLIRTFKGADLAKLAIPAADSGVLAIGVGIRASSPTGVRIGSVGAGSGTPTFRSYITVQDVDTTYARSFTPSVRFNTFVSQTPTLVDQSVLTLGGTPSNRAIVRFPWPLVLRDSAQLVRVTLEFTPSEPITGLRGDSAYLVARPALADLGGKSSTANDASFASPAGILPGDADTLAFEVRRSVTTWQGESGLPPMFVLQMFPEASTFSVARLGSSRSAEALRPRLRVTYVLTYPFGNP